MAKQGDIGVIDGGNEDGVGVEQGIGGAASWPVWIVIQIRAKDRDFGVSQGSADFIVRPIANASDPDRAVITQFE